MRPGQAGQTADQVPRFRLHGINLSCRAKYVLKLFGGSYLASARGLPHPVLPRSVPRRAPFNLWPDLRLIVSAQCWTIIWLGGVSRFLMLRRETDVSLGAIHAGLVLEFDAHPPRGSPRPVQRI